MSDFSLIALIRKVIDETDLANPADIAAKVAEMVPPKSVREAFAQALPFVVQVEVSRYHSAPPRRSANPSSKVAALRDYADVWRVKLRERISVGNHDWKLLADCSATDFRQAAEGRRVHAAGALANAARFDTYAAACEEHKVARFADLPEKVQAELLGGAEKAA
jgi:hypothetical protein